jgi:polyisoprenoid-binding protein YceI
MAQSSKEDRTMKTRPRLVLSTVAGALLALAATVPAAAAPGTWVVDREHSQVSFQVRHLLSKVRGQFDDYTGTVVYDPENPGRSSVEFTIETKSINTFHAKRDEHLRSGDFFDVASHPRITFRSTKVVPLGEGRFAVTGPLTMRGVTREVTLPVQLLGTARDPWGNTKSGFATSLVLDRQDYGVQWNAALDQGGTLVGDEVEIEIQLETALQAPAAAATGR